MRRLVAFLRRVFRRQKPVGLPAMAPPFTDWSFIAGSFRPGEPLEQQGVISGVIEE